MPATLTRPPRLGPRRLGGLASIGDTTPRVTLVTPDRGRLAGGLAITITGSGFALASDGSAPVVRIGGILATSIVLVNSQTITAVTPVSTLLGPADVTVTQGSQTGTLAGGFTYLGGSIASIAPASGTVSGGTPIVLLGSNFVTGSTITIGGVPATGVVFIDSGRVKAITPAHSQGAVDVVITEPGGAIVTFPVGFRFTVYSRGADIRRDPGISIHDTLRGAPNTCTLVIDGRSQAPTVGEKMEVRDAADGNRLLFAGSTQAIAQVYGGTQSSLAWHVSLTDWTWLANRRRPFGSYVNVSASDIVIDLVAKFAPGFTTAHVQTRLARISIVCDGSKDFSTVFDEIASAIGGGHWYWDYVQDLHFFHVAPPGSVIPPSETTIAVGHLTIAEGAGIASTFSYPPGFYALLHTFVYDDGTETSVGQFSNLLEVDGHHRLHVTGLPIGPAIGGLTCVARRIYYLYLGPTDTAIDTLTNYAQVNDNVTTAFTSDFGAQSADVATVVAIPATIIAPVNPFLTAKAAPNSVLSATVLQDADSPYRRTVLRGWKIQFRVAYLYRDGSVSYVGAPSGVLAVDPPVDFSSLNSTTTIISGFTFSAVPIGPPINGIEVIARLIFFSVGVEHIEFLFAESGYVVDDPDWSPETSGGVYVIPNNTDDGITVNLDVDLVEIGQLPTYTAAEIGPTAPDPIPSWPNDDGPSLEDTDPPADLVDGSPLLLFEPKFTSETDFSQIRNRVLVFGGSSLLTVTAQEGDVRLNVADPSSYAPAGGRVRVQSATGEQLVLRYSGVDGRSGETSLRLRERLTATILEGATVSNFYQADDRVSQQLCAAWEVDANGDPTDGIHEYVIIDPSLTSGFSLYTRAHAELELFSRPIVTIHYATRDPKTRSGQTVHVDLIDPPCSGDFLIQDVTIDQIRDPIAPPPGYASVLPRLSPRYTVTACSVRFDLNDLLLKLVSNTQRTVVSSSGVVSSARRQARGQGTWDVWITKAHDQDTPNSVVNFDDDTELQFEVRDNTTWSIELLIRYAADSSGKDLNWCVAVSNGTMAGAVQTFGLSIGDLATDITLALADVATSIGIQMGTGVNLGVVRPFRALIEVQFKTAAAGGSAIFKLRFCGNSSGVGLTRICAGSILRAEQIQPVASEGTGT